MVWFATNKLHIIRLHAVKKKAVYLLRAVILQNSDVQHKTALQRGLLTMQNDRFADTF
jgi:hypothetical protein